jgi:hypothetical protein
MLLRAFLVCLLLMKSLVGQAQKEATTWYFSQRAGFDFSAGSPRPLANSARPFGAPSVSLSDKRTGQLLFYSDARSVWNRQHQRMPHGDSLQGNSGIWQGALTLPVPGQDQQYYLFTLAPSSPDPTLSPAARLSYSVLDLRLANGLGDVVAEQKNRLVTDAVNYQLCAVPHRNGRDYWLLTRQWNNNKFGVYLVNAQGIALAHIQAIGPAQVKLSDIEGFLKASPNGHKVAYVTSETLPLSLFDFDAETGEFSHYLNLGKLLSVGGLSFSPDNTKLYVQNYTMVPDQGPGGRLRTIISQFDLAAGNDAAVVASGMSIVANNPGTNIQADGQSSYGLYCLQLAPDGRLYGNSSYLDPALPLPADGTENLFVINAPNRRGFACEVRYQSYTFSSGAGTSAGPGFPSFLETYFDGLEPVAMPTPECAEVTLSVFPNPTTGRVQLQVPTGCFTPYEVIIYNTLGQRVYVRAITTALSEILMLDTLAPGVYLLEAQIGGKRLHSKLSKAVL